MPISDEAGNNPTLNLSTLGRETAHSEKCNRWCAGSRASSSIAGCSYRHQRLRQEPDGRHWGRY